MGQAKNRQAEIAKLKQQDKQPKQLWVEMRKKYVSMLKEDNEVYLQTLMSVVEEGKKDTVMEVMKSADNTRMTRAVLVGEQLVQMKIATVAEIKDAAWEGFNGLLEACCVEQNIQDRLGLEVSEINPDDFIFTGPDAMERAMKAWA